MKKIKIMLMSLALFAIVGGALAFKARFNQAFCTANPINGSCPIGKKCPNLAFPSAINPAGPVGPFCTTTAVGGACNQNTACLNQAPVRLTNND